MVGSSVELPLCQAMDFESAHSAKPGARVSENIGEWAAHERVTVPFLVPPLGLLRPNVIELRIYRLVQALEKLLRDPSAGFWIQPQRFGN